MTELLRLLHQPDVSALDKLSGIARRMMDDLRIGFVRIRLNGVGEIREGAAEGAVRIVSVGGASAVGELEIPADAGGGLDAYVQGLELLHRLQSGYIDGLTGLYNRRRLDMEIDGLKLAGADPVAIVMMDLDKFKNINDTHGHPAGDAVLKAFSERLMDHLPDDSLLARYGGEEFCLVLRGASEQQAAEHAESLRVRAIADDVQFGRKTIRFTSSAGVAGGVSSASDQVLAQADQALYGAKQGGRNQTVRASELARLQSGELFRKIFRRVHDRPLADLGWYGNRVIGLDRRDSRLICVDCFGGAMQASLSIQQGSLSFVRARGRTFSASPEGVRIAGALVPSMPPMRKIKYDPAAERFLLISLDGSKLYVSDTKLSRWREVELAAPGRGLTDVLPLGRSVLVLDGLTRQIVRLDRRGLEIRKVWDLPTHHYPLTLAYMASAKVVLVGSATGSLLIDFSGASVAELEQPALSAYDHPLVGLALSAPEGTYILK